MKTNQKKGRLRLILLMAVMVIFAVTSFGITATAEEPAVETIGAAVTVPNSDGATFTYMEDDAAVTLSAESTDDALSFFDSYDERLNDITTMKNA